MKTKKSIREHGTAGQYKKINIFIPLGIIIVISFQLSVPPSLKLWRTSISENLNPAEARETSTHASIAYSPCLSGEASSSPDRFYIPIQKSNIKYQNYIVTAYCPCRLCCGKNACGITASGHKIKSGDKIVAAPPEIPFGTKIYIPGYGIAVVKDRGRKIVGSRLDVYFDSHADARKWGRKNLTITLTTETRR